MLNINYIFHHYTTKNINIVVALKHNKGKILNIYHRNFNYSPLFTVFPREITAPSCFFNAKIFIIPPQKN